MNPLSNIYYQGLIQNERNSRFWEEYLKNLESLDFKQYTKKLRVPVLVPIGSRILFPGELKHTNEVTVALGANYFTKCSIDQAEILKQHRINDAKSKLETLKKEKNYLEDQLSFNKKTEDSGKDIVEYQSEEEDESWRKKHRENVRQYKQNLAKIPRQVQNEVTDEELWNRLEELELQEELEEELLSMKGESADHNINIVDNRKSFIGNEEDEIMKQIENQKSNVVTIKTEVTNSNNDLTNRTSKMELLQKVLDKQNELEQKLSEIRNKEKSESRTEQDVLSRLDEMEQLDELEDEMNRLDNVLMDDMEELDNDIVTQSHEKLKRNVTFKDEDDSETLEVEFTHSSVEPPTEAYNKEVGITKPSDIYEAYPHLFSSTTSILKQTNYNVKKDKCNIVNNILHSTKTLDEEKHKIKICVKSDINKTIVIQDIVEKVTETDSTEYKDTKKPISLFKQRRLQKK